MANIRLVQDSVLNENVRNDPTLLNFIPSKNYSLVDRSTKSKSNSTGKAIFAPDAFTNPFVRGGMISHT